MDYKSLMEKNLSLLAGKKENQPVNKRILVLL